MTKLTEEEQNVVIDLKKFETMLRILIEKAADLGIEIQHQSVSITRLGDLVNKEVHNFRAVKVLKGW